MSWRQRKYGGNSNGSGAALTAALWQRRATKGYGVSWRWLCSIWQRNVANVKK
jgi:hypothetical protein